MVLLRVAAPCAQGGPAFEESLNMAQRCELCGKGPRSGNRVSHAHNVTHRRFNPNLQRMRAVVDGVQRRVRVCTRCLRSGKVTKPTPQKTTAAS
jgi:large subunit ribosomal protein L28